MTTSLFPFDLQLFADDDDLSKLSLEELVAMVKSGRKESAGFRSRITVLESEKTRLNDELTVIKTERDSLKTAEAEREEQRLKDEKKWEELATKEREKREKAEKDAKDAVAAAQQKALDDVAARDKQILRSEVRTAAAEAGIVDKDDVDLFGLDGLKLEDGKVVGFEEWLTKAKEAKPHKFKDPTNSNPTPTPRPTPTPQPKPLDRNRNQNVDFRTLSDEEFANRERELLANIGAV